MTEGGQREHDALEDALQHDTPSTTMLLAQYTPAKLAASHADTSSTGTQAPTPPHQSILHPALAATGQVVALHLDKCEAGGVQQGTQLNGHRAVKKVGVKGQLLEGGGSTAAGREGGRRGGEGSGRGRGVLRPRSYPGFYQWFYKQ